MRLSLVILLTTALQTEINATSIDTVLENFQNEFDIKTVIVFAFNTTNDMWLSTSGLNLFPKMVITHETAYQLKRSMGERILSFVFIDNVDQGYLEDIVKPSLWRLHLRDVIFYTNSSLASSPNWHWLFEWCWRQGFWQVLLMTAEDTYLTMNPLPKMEIIPITFRDYLEKRHGRLTNLQGYPIKVSVGNNPPRVHGYYNDQGELVLSGLYGITAKIFVSTYNATLEPIVMPNMSHYSVLSCVQYLQEHKVDFCSDAILYDNDIETARSDFLSIGCGRLMVPFDTPLEMYNYFMKPFRVEAWFLILMAFICSVLLLAVVEYREYGRLEFQYNILITFQSFIGVTFQLNSIPLRYRSGLEALLIFTGFMFSNCYLAYLSSILLTKIYRNDIANIPDVIAQNLTILITKFHQYIMEESQVDEEIKRQTLVASDYEVYENLRNLNPHYGYFGLDNKLDFYLYQQKFMLRPRMKKLSKEVITTDIGGMPMRSYWPLQEIFMDFMDNLFCSGIMGHIEIVTGQEGVQLRLIRFFPTEIMSVESLSLKYFVLCGIILGVGYTLGFVVFLMEIFVYCRIRRK